MDDEELIEWVAEIKDRVTVLEREVANLKEQLRYWNDKPEVALAAWAEAEQ